MNWQKILPSVPAGTPKTPSRMEALAQLRRLEVQEKRAELEHLRRYYGDSWLQAVEDQAVLPRPSSSSAVAHVTDSASERAAETSQSSRKPAGKDNSVTVVVELHNGVAGKPELQSAASRNSAEGAFHKDAMFLSSESGAKDGGTSDVPAQASARLQPCGDDLHTDDNSQRTEEMLLSGNSQLAVGKDHNKAEEKDERVKKKGEESPGLWDSLHDTMIEPGKYKSMHDTMIELGKYKSVHDTMIDPGKYKSVHNTMIEPGKYKSVHDTMTEPGKYKSVHDTMIDPDKYKSVHDTMTKPGKYKSAWHHDWPG